MTKEKLLARRADVQRQKEQMVAQVNVLNGIIGDCDYWLSELDKPEDPQGDKPSGT